MTSKVYIIYDSTDILEVWDSSCEALLRLDYFNAEFGEGHRLAIKYLNEETY